MKKMFVGLMLLVSMSSFAADEATCTTVILGESPVEKSVDFSTMEYDELGFKIVTLLEKDNYQYTVEVSEDNDGLTINVGSASADGVYTSEFLTSGSAPSLFHNKNSVAVSCK